MSNKFQTLKMLLPPKTAKGLEGMGIFTVQELLQHYPRRYANPGQPTAGADLVIGEHVSVLATVKSSNVLSNKNGGYRLEVSVTSGGVPIKLTFFGKNRGQLEWRANKQLANGAEGIFTGVVGQFRQELQFTHPDYLLIGGEQAADEETARYEAGLLIPIYPATTKFPTWNIQKAVRMVLDPLREEDVTDPVPAEVREQLGLGSRFEALKSIHKAASLPEALAARERLKFEEAFVLQTALAVRRAEAAAQPATARPLRGPGDGDSLLERFDASLPFALTAGQVTVGDEISADLSQTHPMQRLLQGEVGTGKTVVALRAMLQVIDAGGQAALLAPTEVLAAQHLRSLTALLGPLARTSFLDDPGTGVAVTLLTGSLPTAARKQALLDVASGQANIVVGTHALLGDQVQFADLGLLVVDEQHRFGVEQRDALRSRGALTPHLLVMTATPIPRTVAMTVFGDLETSTLTEIPAGRSGITTHVVPAENAVWMQRVIGRIREEVSAGHRVFVVCPRINPDDKDTEGDMAEADLSEDGPPRRLRAVLEVAEELRAHPDLAGIAIEVLHGGMSAPEKDDTMTRFQAGQTQVLVATTVIEVGVDVPEATLMVIYDADRFGLAQLHQLRGRVGRGAAPGLCLLISSAPPGTDAATRIEALAVTNDGFELAAVDLGLRNEGDVLGSAQSGRTRGLKLLRVIKDEAVIERARVAATETVASDPTLAAHPDLAAAIAANLSDTQAEFLDRS